MAKPGENSNNNPQQYGLGGIPVPEQHVEYEPDPNEINYFKQDNDQPEEAKDEAPKLHDIDLNVPKFTDEQVAEALQKDKEAEQLKIDKENMTLADYDKMVYQQEQVLDMLNKKQESLESYSRTHSELLKEREKEISDYIHENRKLNKKTLEDNLPKNLDDYDAMLSDPKKHHEMHLRIDKVIEDEKKIHDSANTMADFNKLKVGSLDEYTLLLHELSRVQDEISEAGPEKLDPKDQAWFAKNAGKPKLTESALTDYQHNYNEYKARLNDYSDKKSKYTNATGFGKDGQRASETQDYEFYQTLVARQLVLKNAISGIAMGPGGVIKDFETLENLGKQTVVKEFNINNLAIKEKLSLAAAGDNKELKDLGYTFDNAQQALDDYYELDKKVKEYRPIIESHIRNDKMLDKNVPENMPIIETAQKREQWLKDHSSRYVDDYFNKDGSEKKPGESGLRKLSADYSPDKDQIAYRDGLKKEMDQARFDYYKAAQSSLMLQKNAINEAIKKDNARIDRENKILKQIQKEEKKWKNQEACDERFKENVQKKADEATSKRRKMMMGSMVTRFATTLTASVGGYAEKGGTILAESIVRGERVQVENDLKELKEKLGTKQASATASLYNAQQNRNEARRLDADNSKKTNKDLAFYQVLQSGEHTIKAQKASSSHITLEEQVKAKEEELVKAKAKEQAGIAAIEEKIGGTKKKEIDKKLDQNQVDIYENNISTLATDLNNANKTLQSVKVGDDLVLSENLIKDLMNAKNDLRKQELAVQEKKLLNEDKDLQATMKTLNDYGKKLSAYMTTGNLQKVDTIVGIAETLYSAYSSVSKYLDDKEEAKQQEEEAKKVSGTAEDFRNQAKAEKDEKKAAELNAKAEALENAAKKYEKEDDPFELNIKDTIGDMKEKAQKINESMKGGGEDKATIIQNITDLTLEASQIINIVSKKLDGIASGMEMAYEEALAREESEKKFYENINEISKNNTGEVVKTALSDIRAQQKTHDELVKKDLDDNAEAIRLQEGVLKGAIDSRKAYLDSIGQLAKREEEERKEALKKAEQKLAEEYKKAETSENDTDSIRKAREALNAAKTKEQNAEAARNTAERDLKVKKGTNALAKEDLDEKKHLKEVFEQEQKNNKKQADTIQNDSGIPYQMDKNKKFLELRQADANNAKSAIRKTAVISFFVGVANSAAQNAKGFMDQLTVGAAESVVKGKAKQIEDELADLETAYRLKGETAIAKNRSAHEHIKKAEKLKTEIEELEKKKKKPDKVKQNQYDAETHAEEQDRNAAKSLNAERDKIGEDIKKKREELAKARAEEKIKLDALHKQLKEQYNVNPEEAEISIDIKTGLNQLKVESAKKKVEGYIAENKDFIDILTSNAYIESDAAQRQVIKEQVRNLKQDKDVEAKAEKLDKYSDTLKGLFTPNNMSRVDTIVSAAETVVGLFGSVKGFITGSGGDSKEDEESKGIADKIADMKEKASDIRKGMMEAGDDKEKEQGVIDNILDIAASMREITDTIAKKIDGFAKDYEERLEDQREIKLHADNEVKAYKDIFDKKPEIKLDEAFAEKRMEDDKSIAKNLKDSIEMSEDALKASEKPLADAEKEFEKKEAEYKNANAEVDAARDELNRLVDIEIEKKKGAALNYFRNNVKPELLKDTWKDDYFQELNDLFPQSEEEIRAEERFKAEQKRAEMEQQYLDKQQELINENKKLVEEANKKAAERENELQAKLSDVNSQLNKEKSDHQKMIEEQQNLLAAQIAELEAQKAKIAEMMKTINDQKNKIDENQLQRQQQEQQRQDELDHQFAAEQQRKQDNYAKLDKLDDILANLNETNNGYFGHKNSTQFETMRNQLYNFVNDREKNVEFKPEQTERVQKALTDYLDHVGMGVASHHNGNVRKENALAALNLINPDLAHDYEVKASVKREKEKDSKKIDLKTLMDKDTVKRDPNKPKHKNKNLVEKAIKDPKLPEMTGAVRKDKGAADLKAPKVPDAPKKEGKGKGPK